MHPSLMKVANSLEELSNAILKAYSSDQTMTEVWGWNCPPLSRNDLAQIAINLSIKIKENEINDIPDHIVKTVNNIPKRIDVFKAQTLPYLFNGNGVHASACYTSLMNWVLSVLEPIYGWQILQDNKALPNQLARRLRSMQAELSEIIPDKENLIKQLNLIQKATEAAESLPTDLEALKEARSKVEKHSTQSSELYLKIESAHKKSEDFLKSVNGRKIEADKLVAQCEEAYRITTTKGLAGAFDQRATRLTNSMWIWVAGLLASLAFGVYVGAARFEAINEALKNDNPSYVWMHFVISILSLGPSIWFAWIATKQIGQRFKLSEDYAYKASVAKAYEGYRREAAQIDEELEARLFISALTRLEEAPLRLMEKENHGSPWHELFQSNEFRKALEAVPEFKDKLISLSKKKTDED